MEQGLVLVINCGSSSIKFALVDPSQSGFLISGLAERLAAGNDKGLLHWQQNAQTNTHVLATPTHHAALVAILPKVQAIAGSRLIGVGHRVVHGVNISVQRKSLHRLYCMPYAPQCSLLLA